MSAIKKNIKSSTKSLKVQTENISDHESSKEGGDPQEYS